MPVAFDTATLAATRAWLVDPTNPSASPLKLGTRTTSDPNLAVDGEYRQYSNGASGMVSYETQTSTVGYTFVNIDRATRLQLEQWRGKTLLYRTIDGERWFVSYLAVVPHRHLFTSRGVTYDVSVTFNIVSYDENQA